MDTQATIETPKSIVLDIIEDTEVAELLGVSVLTLKRWRRIGKGPSFIKIGRRSAYQVEDIKDWIVSTKCSSTAEQRMRGKR